MKGEPAGWVCCQIGAREHYAIPRVFHTQCVLRLLFTDVWVKPASPIGMLKNSLRERYHPQLADARVKSATGSFLGFEASARLKGLGGWDRIIARNQWFQKQAVRRLEEVEAEAVGGKPPALFAYSYAAGEILRWARDRGWRTVLGQIDPGPLMGRLIRQLEQQNPEWGGGSPTPPETYWQNWRRECEFADAILVNSEWSREELVHERMAASKIKVVPLAFDMPPGAAAFSRAYPATFSCERPLRVLFLGQVNLLKGIAALAHAAERLKGEPVEFRVVGPVHVQIPEQFRGLSSLRFLGPVARSAAAEHFRQADVFLFPTFCDGFGLTQLEAQAWRLPIIASPFCGEVVEHGRNGVILGSVTGETIAAAILSLLKQPSELARMADASEPGMLRAHQASTRKKIGQFTLARLAENLTALQAELLEEN